MIKNINFHKKLSLVKLIALLLFALFIIAVC